MQTQAMQTQAMQTQAMHLPTHEEIAHLAHSYWEARGREDGSPEEDWFRAERALAANGGAPSTP